MCQARRRLLRSMKKFARKQTLSLYVPLLINGFAKNLLVMLDVELCNNKLNDRGDIEHEYYFFIESLGDFSNFSCNHFRSRYVCKTDCFSDRNSRIIPMQSVKFRPEKLKNTEVSSY